MAQVTDYHVLYYDTADGYGSNRAQIQLMNGETVLGWIRFHDPGMPFPDDTQVEGKIIMHLPSAMLESVLDILRNEKPIYYYFASDHTFLGTSREPIGEDEQKRPECPDMPADLPITRAPIPFEWRGHNNLTIWRNQPQVFETEMQELAAFPPILLFPEGGYHAHVENPFQWGAVKGIADEVYGDWSTPGIGQILDAGLPDPEMLAQRFADLATYLAEYEGITKPAPYADLGTQLYGNWDTRTGFWRFHDHWDDYAAPAGPFDLGPMPPDPTTWLRKWYDPNHSSVCRSSIDPNCAAFTEEELENFQGLSFVYGPKKDNYGSYYRYAVCLNTEGWELWWKQTMRWLARVGFRIAFIDNTHFKNCWNEECQRGYRDWLTRHFGEEEIGRFFTVSTSLLDDHSFEGNWYQETGDENGVWRTTRAYTLSGALFPDIDSYDGRYSARFEGPGELRLYTYPLDPEDAPQEERDYCLTIHYKTDGDIGARLQVKQLGEGNPELVNEPLAAEAEWTAFAARFHTPANVLVQISFDVERDGRLWLDEFWLAQVTVRDGEEVVDHPVFRIELAAGEDRWNHAGRLRQWASAAYWNSVVDEKIVYLRDNAREITRDFEIFTNSYVQRRGSDYFLVEGQALGFESSRQDAGHPPGIYRPAPEGEDPWTLRNLPVDSEVLNTNIFDYKYGYSKRLPDFFSYHLHALVSTRNPREENEYYSPYLHNPDSALLTHAEAAAFGAGAGIDLQLRAPEHRTALTSDERLALRELSRQFFQFVDDHRFLFECLRSYGEVGLVYHDLRFTRDPVTGEPDHRGHHTVFELAQALASRGVLWDVLSEERCYGTSFARYKVLTYHDVERISEAEAQALIDFMEGGGLVIASGSEDWQHHHWPGAGGYTRFYIGMLDEFFRLRAANPQTVWPPPGVTLSGTATEIHEIGAGRLISVPAGALDVGQVVQWIEGFFADKGTSRALGIFVHLPSSALERMRVAAWTGPNKLVLHLVNYDVPLGKDNRDQVDVLSDVEVEVRLPQVWDPSSVHLYTPEALGSSGEVPFSMTPEGDISFVIPALHIYEIALIE